MTSPYNQYGGSLSDEEAKSLGVDHLRMALKSRSNKKIEESSSDRFLPQGDITFEFIRDQSFNAIAFLAGDAEFVGINVGVIKYMTIFAASFFGDPDVFPEFGERQEDFKNSIGEMLSNPEAVDLSRLSPNHIRGSERVMLASRMNLIVYEALLQHEINHIVRCHIPLLISRGEAAHLIEVSSSPRSLEHSRMRRAIELDADEGAVRMSYLVWDGMRKSKKFPEIKDENFVEIWSASLTMLFRLMLLLEVKAGVKGPRSTHPSPEARLHNFVGYTTIAEEDLPNVDEDRVFAGIREVNRWWKKHGLAELHLDTTMQQVKEELVELHEIRASLRAELEKYQARRKTKLLNMRQE